MKDLLKSYFDSKNVEYYAAVSYSDCKEINKNIMEREDFIPKSVIVFLLPYYTGETENISRYAASLDYHLAIREITDGLISAIKVRLPEARTKGYGDHSPINEVHAALISGLGVMGDNGLIINEKYGTYVFIGDVVTDIDPEVLGAVPAVDIRRCEGCSACKRACPTGALTDYSRECLSAITQRKGTLPVLIDRPHDLKSVRCGSLVFSLPISFEKKRLEYVTNGVERKYPYCDYEYVPLSDWNYAYADTSLKVETRALSDVPFSSQEPPVVIRARVKKIGWGLEDGYETVCAKVPESREPISDEQEMLLYPYGCAKLRMTEIPLLSE